MNRYPLWKYVVIAVALLIGVFYTLPNFFAEVPAVQVSTSKSNVKIDASTLQTVEEALKAANVPYRGETVDATGVKVRFADPDTQLKAKDVLQAKLNPDPNSPNYIVALNLLSSSPRWLAAIGALPMYLGLDLRGGVHFLLQVDMKAALDKAADRYLTDIRSLLREKKVLYAGIAREGQNVGIRFRDAAERDKANVEIVKAFPDLQLNEVNTGTPVLVKRQVVLTGDRINDAQPGFDSRNNEPAVHINLDGTGARIFKELTRENVGKRMAIVLVEKGKAEAITAPVIREEIGGGRVQISGRMNTREANDIALLMRAGALAAPMEIVEERTVGPSLGKEKIDKGFNSVTYGFCVLAVFMCIYYLLMGVISTVALTIN